MSDHCQQQASDKQIGWTYLFIPHPKHRPFLVKTLSGRKGVETKAGEVERLTEMGGVAWRTEFDVAIGGGGGFRGGKGGDLVDDGSVLLPIFANGLCD